MPPKSAAERMRAYRFKMSEDKRKKALENNRNSQKKSRSKWDGKRKKEESILGAMRKSKSRELKKESRLLVKISTPTKMFGSRQSFGRAIAKITKQLPSSPKKKTAVVKSLASKFGFLTPPPKNTLKVPPEHHQRVIDFFNSDLLSWQMPGRKDFITMNINDSKEKVQKKVMLMTVKEAHSIFKRENNIKIGKSTFAKLRPQNIMPVSERDQNVCCCIYHENFDLLCEGFIKIQQIPNRKALQEGIVCDIDNVQCNIGDCEKCADVSKYLEEKVFDSSIDDNVQCSFIQWTDRVKKEECVMSFSKAKKEFTKQLVFLRKHSFIAKIQIKQKKYLQENLNEGEVVIHEDFAENFAMKQQNEIMSAHWLSQTIIVFTAVVTSKHESKSYALISENITGDSVEENNKKGEKKKIMKKHLIATFNRVILHNAICSGLSCEKVHFFSDGPSVQFKNCSNLSTITTKSMLHNDIKEADWSFFATAHDKGPVDGIGGTVKRAVWRRILQKKVVVNNSKEFSVVAAEACPNITVIHVPQSKIFEVYDELETFWSQNPPQTIKDTRGHHYFKPVSDTHMAISIISPFLPNYECETTTVKVMCKELPKNKKAQKRTRTGTEIHQKPSSLEDTGTVLKKRGYQEIGLTPGDGNCFFWAVSNLLDLLGKSSTHKQIREDVCEYISNLDEEYKSELKEKIPGNDLNAYLQKMTKIGTYADHIVIEFFSKMEDNQMIKIIDIDSKDIVIGSNTTKPIIYLGYIPKSEHYVSIEPLRSNPSSLDKGAFDTNVMIGQYYAVDYVDRFYIGRILKEGEKPNHFEIKFLHQMSRFGHMHFYWPKKDDIDNVFIKNIFFGPVQLEGHSDFTCSAYNFIKNRFHIIKNTI